MSNKKDSRITLRLTDEERVRIEKLAKEKGISLSAATKEYFVEVKAS